MKALISESDKSFFSVYTILTTTKLIDRCWGVWYIRRYPLVSSIANISDKTHAKSGRK